MSVLYDSKSITLDNFGMKELFTLEAKVESWLEVESALAAAQGELGIIPKEAAENINMNAKVENIDFDEMTEILKKVGHNFVPFLKVFGKACDPEAAKYIHYGITTQNVQQTSQLLRVKKFNGILKSVLKEIIIDLEKLALEHIDTIIPGRTHGKHALPITFGFKVAGWIEELRDALDIIESSEERIFKVMMGGAVGGFHALGEQGIDVQNLVAQKLEMGSMPIPSRAIRVNRLEYMTNMSLLASILNKIGEEIYRTSSEEFDELSEAFIAGTVGSSTMPQKVNPKLAKGIIANSQKIFSVLNSSLYASSKPFEADSSSYILMETNLNEILELMCEAVIRMKELSSNLTVDTAAMKKNVGLTKGLINSENVMMHIANKVGKEKAHEIVYNLAMECEQSGLSYEQVLMTSEMLSELYTEEEIKAMVDPKNYIGLCELLVKKTISK